MARLSAVRDELTRADRVAFVLVLIPERLPIEESARAAHQLEDAGIHLGGLVVNRVLPDAAEGRVLPRRGRRRSGSTSRRSTRRLPDGAARRGAAVRVGRARLAGLERVGRYLLDDSAGGR